MVVLGGAVGPLDQRDIGLGVVGVDDPHERVEHRDGLAALGTETGEDLAHPDTGLVGGRQPAARFSGQAIPLAVGTMDALGHAASAHSW